VKGDLILKHHLGKKTALKGLETLFIEDKKDELLPYFIESIKIKSGDELYLKIEGINSREEAQKLMQKQVWLVEEEFHKYAGKSAPISFLGFHMIQDDEDLGEILEVIEQPHQLLCRIEWKGKEALIPIHQETLIKVDKKKKVILVNLPEGLLDVFT
jgi:16S rRNA processing protein RimM